ncbi:putative porin [Prevotella pectinovora]|uniref:putative porin n=1 Tax=Prevotella pectinovora TaxID=1602169 RepID=UPI00307D2B8C
MKLKRILPALLLSCALLTAQAQDLHRITDNDNATDDPAYNFGGRKDSTKVKDKIVPKGLSVWTVDERFGDRTSCTPDTASHMFMNTIFTSGLRGEYNTTGNLGAPRYNRIFIDNPTAGQFLFTQPYSFFNKPVGQFLFTNTLSPVTNISYNECGDRSNGEDHLKALFAVNAGKDFGAGFKFDYIYGRGYYQNQSTSHFNYSMYASYLGERYNAHLLFSLNHQKVAENGGITDDRYITHPEMFDDDFSENEIPTVLEQNWNRNDNQHIFFSHRYNVGFSRKVKMTESEIQARKFAIESKKENEERENNGAKDGRLTQGRSKDDKTFGRPENSTIAGDEPYEEKKGNPAADRIAVDGKAAADSLAALEAKRQEEEQWMKDEYVPVTSFIHTLSFDNYRRIYQAYQTPTDFYADTYDMDLRLGGDSIYDKTRHYSLKNTLAIAMLEGFNKWAKAGLKIFATSELRHFSLPAPTMGTDSYNEHNLSIGAQMNKTQGSFRFNATAEATLTGTDAGQLKLNGQTDLRLPLLGDTLKIDAKAGMERLLPTFYYRHYHARHLWWDKTLDKETRANLEGVLTFSRTKTRLRVAFSDIKNYTYFAQRYTITEGYGRTGNTVEPLQHTGNITLLTLQLDQNFRFGPVFWENNVTYQKSSNQNVLPVPELNLYTNLYLRFKIAKVLKVDLGADMRYFTKYFAPDYSPALGQFAIQDNGEQNVKTGSYPIVNVYANMHLKQTRFFIMMSHVNATDGNAFLTPHYPINKRVLRFGLSWNFFN